MHNAGRSQLAAGLAAARAGSRVRVLSAGTEPDDRVDPVMLASLAEIGIDRSDQTPTRLTADLLAQADMVVVLKPDLPLTHAAGVVETWQLPEPDRWDLDGLRPLRDHLDQRVADLLDRVEAQRDADEGTDRAANPAASNPAAAIAATIAG